MDYLDFEVRIGERTGNTYPVLVVKSPMGEPSATTQVPLSDPIFKQHLQMVEHLHNAVLQTRHMNAAGRNLQPDATLSTTERDAAEEIGRLLFAALLL